MVYGAGGRDGQFIFIQDGHVRRPKVIGGRLDVEVVGVFMGAVWKNHAPDAFNEGGVNQMIRSLKGE